MEQLGARSRADDLEVPVIVTAEGKRIGESTWPMSAQAYWSGIPTRFRDPAKFVVERTIQLELGARTRPPRAQIVVRERDRDLIAWTSR